ncbi:MAG: TetR/AcrR family transcriptional regulator [Chloroflexota bacterium]
MSPRPDVSEERKRQILDAAMAVFSRLGFHKARMDDIVDESGLSKGTLYWYFKSKDEIILGILENMFQHELADLEELTHAEGSISERMMEFASRASEDVQHMLGFSPLTYEFYALAFRNKTVRLAMRNYLRKYIEMTIPIVQQGVQNGEFREVDAEEAALAIGAIIEGTLLLWVYDSESVDISRHLKSSLKLLIDGLRAGPE